MREGPIDINRVSNNNESEKEADEIQKRINELFKSSIDITTDNLKPKKVDSLQ